jgi:homospermidine synthase
MRNLNSIIRRVIKETHEEKSSRYMFFSNLEQMRRQCDLLLDLDRDMVEGILEHGHDWAQDHISEAKNNMDQVFDFLMNESKSEGMELSMNIDDKDMVMMEGRKKKNVATNKKLWQQSLAWAKQRYEVCPSAYCNGAAVKRYNSKGGKWKKE